LRTYDQLASDKKGVDTDWRTKAALQKGIVPGKEKVISAAHLQTFYEILNEGGPEPAARAFLVLLKAGFNGWSIVGGRF